MNGSHYSDKTLSLALAISASVWGLYWIPLRTIEAAGISGAWSVVFLNACPLLVLLPLLPFYMRNLVGVSAPTLLAAIFCGLAFTLYSNGLVETTVIRATLLYYLTPVWSTIVGVLWLSERLTHARIIAILVALGGLFLLVFEGGSAQHPLNIGDLYSLLSGVFWAFAVAVLNRWSNIPILPVATFIFLFTTIISAFFAGVLNVDLVPTFSMLKSVFPTAAFWSIIIILPGFLVIFRVSQLLFPGRVGILCMSEVIVAIISASILLPDERMGLLQWVGAGGIVAAGFIEVLFGYVNTENESGGAVRDTK